MFFKKNVLATLLFDNNHKVEEIGEEVEEKVVEVLDQLTAVNQNSFKRKHLVATDGRNLEALFIFTHFQRVVF